MWSPVALADTPLGDMSNNILRIGIAFSVVWILFWLAIIFLVREQSQRPRASCD